MTAEKLKKWSEDNSLLRIVEIKTKEYSRRGLFKGIQPDGSVVFLWIPYLAPKVRSINGLQMEVVAMVTRYEPRQILSIK